MRRAFEGPERDTFHDEPDDEGAHERDDKTHDQVAWEEVHGDEGKDSAHHEHFAVGKGDQVKHAEDQGEADGQQGVDATQRQPIDDLLQKQRHRFLPIEGCVIPLKT